MRSDIIAALPARRPERASSLPLKHYRRILGYVRPYKGVFAVAIVGMLLVASTDVMLLKIVQPLLNNVGAIDAESLWWLPYSIVGVFVLRGFGSYASEYGLAWIGSRVVFDLRCEACDHLLRLPTPFYDATSAGFLLSRITFDAQQIAATASEAITVSIRNSLTIAFMLGYLLYLNWQLTLIALATIPLLAVSLRKITAPDEAREHDGPGSHRLADACAGRGDRRAPDRQGLRRREVRERQAPRGRGQAAAVDGETGGGLRARHADQPDHRLDRRRRDPLGRGAADAARRALCDRRFRHLSRGAACISTNQLKTLSNVQAVTQRGLTAAESVFKLIDEPPEPDAGTIELGRARGDIRFERVTKRYAENGRPALSDIDLDIAPGESVALVGPSGGGKTTLVNLIPRFYLPRRDACCSTARTSPTIRLADLRRQIALVSQEIVLFNDTIAANIAYGAMADAPREAIERAADAANALEFIRAQPDGFATLVGERGIRLSGGQRQRIAIARAILKDAPILILDEATSALDNESERLIQAALEKLMRGRTTIVIAHRLSTIEHCERIIVLDGGAWRSRGRTPSSWRARPLREAPLAAVPRR